MKFFGGLVLHGILGLLLCARTWGQEPATNAPAATLSQTEIAAAQLQLRDGMQAMGANNLDDALKNVDTVLKVEPGNSVAHNLRGAIFSKKKQYDVAKQEFLLAKQADPKNLEIDFNLCETAFLQKQYDDARTGFSALKADPDLGDLAAYKVFLCDLFGGHQVQANAELAVFDGVGYNPSYYFSHAAEDLYNKKIESARGWLNSAANIYPAQKFQYYSSSLFDLGYLPIPPKSPE